MAVPKKKISQYTIEKYLELDRASEERYEFVDGQVFLMAGESGRHGDVSVNLTREISVQLKGKDCRARSKDTKIKSGGFAQKKGNSTKGMFSYPDLVIICGEPEYHDKFKDIVLNPKVIVEVLSDSTEVFDRNDKFTRYRMFNPTLSDYILVSQDKPVVEHFVRQEDDNWKLYSYFGLDETFRIESVECELKLNDVYDRVEFSEESLELVKEIANIKNERI
jgi:Uma2 family endonuclease